LIVGTERFFVIYEIFNWLEYLGACGAIKAEEASDPGDYG
jgi:hypothetical protein